MQSCIKNLMKIVSIQKDPCGNIKILIYMQNLFRENFFFFFFCYSAIFLLSICNTYSTHI